MQHASRRKRLALMVQGQRHAGARPAGCRPRRQPATVQRGVAQCRLQQQMDGTARHTRNGHRWSGSSQQRSACPVVVVSVPAATAGQRPSASARDTRIYDSSWRHMPAIFTCHRRAGSTQPRPRAAWHACCRRGAAGEQLAAVSSRTVPAVCQCLPSIASRAGDRCSIASVRWWWWWTWTAGTYYTVWGLIRVPATMHTYTVPWLLVAVQTTSSCITIREFREHPPQLHCCLVSAN